MCIALRRYPKGALNSSLWEKKKLDFVEEQSKMIKTIKKDDSYFVSSEESRLFELIVLVLIRIA